MEYWSKSFINVEEVVICWFAAQVIPVLSSVPPPGLATVAGQLAEFWGGWEKAVIEKKNATPKKLHIYGIFFVCIILLVYIFHNCRQIGFIYFIHHVVCIIILGLRRIFF